MNFVKSMVAGILTSATLATAALAAGTEINASSTGLALQGYDPVAYHTLGEATKGNYAITASYEDATYWFANEEHKATFEANPAAYAPEYGGYCAFGAAMGFKFDGDPNHWRIVDNELFLNVSAEVQERWLSDIPGFIAQANTNWVDIEFKEPSELQ